LYDPNNATNPALKNVVVLYVNTFEPEDGPIPTTDDFEDALIDGLSIAQSLGLTNLIIDLTQNGGGDICLGQRMMDYLLGPREVSSRHYAPTDMPQSPLANYMANAAVSLMPSVSQDVWTYDSYQLDNLENVTDASWLLDGIAHTRGGLSRNYSQLLHLSPLACSYDPIIPGVADFISQMIVVTHGLCGSTCALFANHAAIFGNVKTMVVGGLVDLPQQYTSFPGLQVLDTPVLFELIDAYFPQDPGNQLIPEILPTTARYRMCVREIYPEPTSDTPTEYTFMSADYHIPSTLARILRPEITWFDAAQFLYESTN